MHTTPDRYWHDATLGCPATLRPWLRDHGSLTQRLQQHCTAFSVAPLRSGLARIAHDESMLLGVPAQRLAYSREVFLLADGCPVVFAHSTCAPAHLQGPWGALAGLGQRSLGSLLFSHPLVRRCPLRFKSLGRGNPLYRRATERLIRPPATLWARRSLFLLHDSPLLVTEVFLPAVLDLRPRN